MSARRLRLLLVEDDPTDAQLVLRHLRQAGFDLEVRRVDDEEGYLRELSPDLDVVISDYNLPQFSAPAALEALQQRGYPIPFIIVSGTIEEETAIAIMRQGASDYLLKDRLARLGQAVSQALEQALQRRLRAQAEAELRESQARFDMLAGTIEEVFWITSSDHSEIIYISPGYEKIWGRSCEDLYARPQSWLEAIHEEDRQRVYDTAIGGPSQTFDIEYRIRSTDGSIRWIQDHATPITDEQGRTIKIVGVARDITARRQLEAEYRQAQKMEALGQLAAGVAHDFNNLLTVIGGNASMLNFPDSTKDDVAQCSAEILAATESAKGLTSQLLMFSRKNVVQRAETDLRDVVSRLTRMLKRVVGADIVLRHLTSADLPPIYADPSMMEQVLLNLVVNARDAMPDGGELIVQTAAMETSESRSGPPRRWACLSVSDSGHGIAPEHLTRLFEPFFTTKEAGHGTGLGLATVFGIVEQHGGRVEVESRLSQGSTFRVLLPAIDPAEAAPESPRAEDKTTLKGGETVLVVEDEVAVRALVVRILSRFGYRVLQAPSGPEALVLWARHKHEIQLLLTDMVMPDGLSGYDLAQRFHEENPNLRVILTSGYSSELVNRGRVPDPSYKFLQKPYESKSLVQMIRDCLDSEPPGSSPALA